MISDEALSKNNVVWYDGNAWVIKAIRNDTVYATKFGEPTVVNNFRFEDLQGIPISIENVQKYLGIEMEEWLEDREDIEDKDWYDKDTRTMRLTNTWWRSNRPADGPYTSWFCHLDNPSMDTIGTADVIYIHELQNFLKLTGYKK
jgi:hypothetical protein